MVKIPIRDRHLYTNTVASSIFLTILCLVTAYITPTPNSSVEANDSSSIPSSGNQISLNGRTVTGFWLQQRATGREGTIYISDGVVRQLIGVDFLNSDNPVKQPIEWFSGDIKSLNANLLGGHRYLDVSQFAQTAGWQMQTQGNILVISTPGTKVTNIRQGKQTWGERVVLDLDRPTPWQVTQGQVIKKESTPPDREWIITIDGTIDPLLLQRYHPQPLPSTPEPLITKVEMVKNQTILRLSVPFGKSVRVSTIANPHRLVIDIRPDALVEKDIIWATGLRWRQNFVNLDTEKFPVVWLEVNPKAFGLTLKPILANPGNAEGTAPLIQKAQRDLAVAAINGGYFNRNNRLPLGAIRRDSNWLSGAILNRGAIAWNNSGQFYFGRLTVTETLISNNSQPLPILFVNSGYVQNGIARYTSEWGSTYTPLTDNEILLLVQNGKISHQFPGGKTGTNPITIPQNGYLLAFRGNAVKTSAKLPIGTDVKITSVTTPSEFSRYPHIVGAGPLLLENRRIVLDAKSEKFSDAFIREKASRSSICTTNTGSLIIAAVHNRVGGAGPSLGEQAKLMQTMGCINALNLDGGSSTGLYLGGQLLDRSPSTAGRIHNGIGIFLKPAKLNQQN
ncbi:phosphodiester glycosidase family protein [Cronbergia sp. UHCC 0137]|uniref:phosphodiester glycosidase family protein n=1 Tax=Cronbergia sp. UHCC 0137 TaxID=3110239 RepID=UPI002B1FE254|nr:phosphodiester glycosidase family protein [Cronbergia sp. UHCC 0137]MEA5618016.1 phosphodiester glycosidase family protein [Cronbergia sp. UHCC 0137]